MSHPPLHAATALVAALLVTCPSRLHAQTAAPTDTVEATAPAAPTQPQETNAGRLSFTAGLDVLSSYMFRGIRQDDRGIIGWPAVDIGVVLFEGDGGVKSVGLNVGLWNSLHSGPTGLDGPTGKMWYESDFYSTVTLGLKGGVNLGTTYTAYISPNDSFRTVKEISFTAGFDDSSSRVPLAPYGLVAVEIDGQADGGTSSGTYLELGVKPGIALSGDRATLSFPAKVGFSLRDYYEAPNGSKPFGYVEAGAVATVPLTFIPRSFGAWSARGGASMLSLGDGLRTSNNGDRFKFVGLLGIALSY